MRRSSLVLPGLSIPLLALAVLFFEPGLAAQAPALPADARGLLKVIERERDDAPTEAFYALARIGTAEAFDASVEATAAVKRGTAVSIAYYAFQFYRGKGELQGRAIEFLFDSAREHQRDEHQLAAARALSAFGTLAASELEQLVREHPEPEVQSAALGAIVEPLLQRDTVDSVALVLGRADPVNRQHAYGLERGLRHVRSASTVALLIEKLRQSETAYAWRSLLVDQLAQLESPAATEQLLELLEGKDPDLSVRAIEALGLRGAEAALKPLWKLLESDDPTLMRAAIVALGRLMGGEEKWVRRLFEIAEDKDPVARLAAAVALAELRTQAAVERLHALLADSDRRVRIEAVQQVGNLRRKDSIPILIDRLAAEDGRIAQDLVNVLRLVTGLDNGTSHARWSTWWQGEGERFEVPAYEAALAAEQARRERREGNVTVSSFYGLNVVSDRVCFVLDYSGSMSAAAEAKPGRTSSGEGSGPTRLKVAQHELSQALQGYPEDDLFNVVFFESGVSAWQDELVEMKPRAREESIAFVNEKQPAGGTNVYEALLEAFADERVDTLYLLTDGDPSAGAIIDPGRLRAEIARINAVRKVEINCISVGQASALLRGLAADSGGEYREVGLPR